VTSLPKGEKLTAIGFGNRGYSEDPKGKDFNPVEEVLFGFVYFNDDRRVTYATGHGVTGSTGGWEPITGTHIRLAKALLDEKVPGWDIVPEKEKA
jgi:hypothetical protein